MNNTDATAACALCRGAAKLFLDTPGRSYYRCGMCSAVFLDPACHVSEAEEKSRYEQHNNDVEDPGYRRFAGPMVREVRRQFGPKHQGLDFGAGTGPVVATLLREKGLSVALYDPFFWNDPGLLEKRYDYIVCSEVIEHFKAPAREFGLLRSLVRPGGALFCQTELYSEKTDFRAWYYRNDCTHIFFYHADTLAWIRAHFRFSSLRIRGRIAQFLT